MNKSFQVGSTAGGGGNEPTGIRVLPEALPKFLAQELNLLPSEVISLCEGKEMQAVQIDRLKMNLYDV